MELQVTHDRIRTSMIEGGIPADTADHILSSALEAAKAAMEAFFARTDKVGNPEWANVYLLGLQILGAYTLHHAGNFKERAEALGIASAFVSFDPPAPDAA